MCGGSVGFEDGPSQGLGQIIGPLFVCRALEDVEFVVVHVCPEPMPLAQEILRSVGNPVIRRQIIGTLIVFKDSRVHRGSL